MVAGYPGPQVLSPVGKSPPRADDGRTTCTWGVSPAHDTEGHGDVPGDNSKHALNTRPSSNHLATARALRDDRAVSLLRTGSILILLAAWGCSSDPNNDDASSTTHAGAGGATGVGGSGASSTAGTGGTNSGTGGAGGGGVAGVEAFVAVGFGGRRMVSCDGGRTWIADQQVADEAQDDWHQTYSPKHLAYGDGTFVFLTGWGTASTAWVSDDGAQWDEVTIPGATYTSVSYADGAFVALGGGRSARSTDGGRTWQDSEFATPVPLNHARTALAADGNHWAFGGDGEVYLQDGASWIQVPGCQGDRHGHLGFEGGLVAGGGRLISVGHDGDTCGLQLADGTGLSAGQSGVDPARRPIYADGQFVVAGGNQIATSADGEQWITQALPNGVTIDLVARGSSGTWVGVSGDGDSFYYSEDGLNWQPASGAPGNTLLYLATGQLAVCGP